MIQEFKTLTHTLLIKIQNVALYNNRLYIPEQADLSRWQVDLARPSTADYS